MNRNELEWPKFVQNNPIWAKNGYKWAQISLNDHKLSKNEPK